MRATGQQWAFAPTLAVVQDVRWGRTYESFGNDPALVARLGRAAVEGLQENLARGIGVLASAKHFVGDGGTRHGTDQGITRATPEQLAKTHGAGYVATLDAGVQTVMASYSSWTDTRSATPNGKMHGNRELLTDVLKQRLAFDGLYRQRLGRHRSGPLAARTTTVPAVLAGTDIFMVPFEWKRFIDNTLRAVQDGRIPMSRIDDAVRRIPRQVARRPRDGRQVRETDATFATDADRALARRAVRESLVLLKHKPGLLPPAGVIARARRGRCGRQHPQPDRRLEPHLARARDNERRLPPPPPACSRRCASVSAAATSSSTPTAAAKTRPSSAPLSPCWPRSPMPKWRATSASPAASSTAAATPSSSPPCSVAGRGAPVVTLLYSGRRSTSTTPPTAQMPSSPRGCQAPKARASSTRWWRRKRAKPGPASPARLRFPWPGGPCQFSTHPDPKATGADKPWWVGGGLSGFEKTARPRRFCRNGRSPRGSARCFDKPGGARNGALMYAIFVATPSIYI